MLVLKSATSNTTRLVHHQELTELIVVQQKFAISNGKNIMLRNNLKCPEGGLINATQEELDKFAAVAKAIGGQISYGHTKRRLGDSWDEWEWIGNLGIQCQDNGWIRNPLRSNSDAFWLMATAKVNVSYDDAARISSAVIHESNHQSCEPYEDILASTRSAIFDAVAKLGGYSK